MNENRAGPKLEGAALECGFVFIAAFFAGVYANDFIASAGTHGSLNLRAWKIENAQSHRSNSSIYNLVSAYPLPARAPAPFYDALPGAAGLLLIISRRPRVSHLP